MKKYLAIFGVIMLLAIGAACTTNNGDGGATGGDTTNGGTTGGDDVQQLYTANCQVCHGADLSGGIGPSLTKVGSLYEDVAEMKDKIIKGSGIPSKSGATGVMTANLVSDDDAQKLAEWLMTKK